MSAITPAESRLARAMEALREVIAWAEACDQEIREKRGDPPPMPDVFIRARAVLKELEGEE